MLRRSCGDAVWNVLAFPSCRHPLPILRPRGPIRSEPARRPAVCLAAAGAGRTADTKARWHAPQRPRRRLCLAAPPTSAGDTRSQLLVPAARNAGEPPPRQAVPAASRAPGQAGAVGAGTLRLGGWSGTAGGAGTLLAGEHQQPGVEDQQLGGGFLKAAARINPRANRGDPVGGNSLDALLAAGPESEGPERMAVPVGAVTGRLSAAAVGKRERARNRRTRRRSREASEPRGAGMPGASFICW